jgi:hypothetical protein
MAPDQRPATPTLSTRQIDPLERTQTIFRQWFTTRVAQTLRSCESRETLPVVRGHKRPMGRQIFADRHSLTREKQEGRVASTGPPGATRWIVA